MQKVAHRTTGQITLALFAALVAVVAALMFAVPAAHASEANDIEAASVSISAGKPADTGVYVAKSYAGGLYHSNSTCSGMGGAATLMRLVDAQSEGYHACSQCAAGYDDVIYQNMHRCYNPNSGEHFYTSSKVERDALVKAGWKNEGVAWVAPSTSSTPVYRLYSGTDHHYTTDAKEKDHLVSVGWKYEGVGWYSADSGTTLLRLFNPNVDPTAKTNNSGSHHYTTSTAERDNLVRLGWKFEGDAWKSAI